MNYKSRDYCKAVNCPVQSIIDKENIYTFDYNKAKNFCRKKCEAYKLHQWLNKNDYTIVKDFNYDLAVLKAWFEELQNKLHDNLKEDDYLDIGLNEPLENIENCIYSLDNSLEKTLRELRNKKGK